MAFHRMDRYSSLVDPSLDTALWIPNYPTSKREHETRGNEPSRGSPVRKEKKQRSNVSGILEAFRAWIPTTEVGGCVFWVGKSG